MTLTMTRQDGLVTIRGRIEAGVTLMFPEGYVPLDGAYKGAWDEHGRKMWIIVKDGLMTFQYEDPPEG